MSLLSKSIISTINEQTLYITPSSKEAIIINIYMLNKNNEDATITFKLYNKFNHFITELIFNVQSNNHLTYNEKIFLDEGDYIRTSSNKSISVLLSITEEVKYNDNINNDLKYMGNFDINSEYHRNNIVNYDNSLYISKGTITGIYPTDVNHWELFLMNNVVEQPIGSIITYSSNHLPIGYLKCNGSEISRTTYNNLYNVIGTIYGEGDGLTTFNIPDLRGEFIRGFDDGRGIDINRLLGSNQSDLFKSHSHSLELYYGSWDSSPRYNHWFSSGSRGRGYGGRNTNSVGGTETRPRNISMLYCIKY